MDKKKTKVDGEPILVSFHRLIEDFGRYAVKERQVPVQQNTMTAHYTYPGLDLFEWHNFIRHTSNNSVKIGALPG